MKMLQASIKFACCYVSDLCGKLFGIKDVKSVNTP